MINTAPLRSCQDRADNDGLARSLETFSGDLLTLSKTFSVYPEGHPAPLRVVQRLAAWSPCGEATEAVLAFTPSRLLMGDRFFGTPGSRSEALAGFFHGRKVMRLTWTARVVEGDVVALATLMASTRLCGTELRDALQTAGAYGIDLEPLEAARIHGSLSLDPCREGTEGGSDERGLEVWARLQAHSVSAEKLAEGLQSDTFWSAYGREPSFATGLLFRHQGTLGAALQLLPEAQREAVRARLAEVPRSLTLADLAAVLVNETGLEDAGGEGVALLLSGMDPATLLELMAQVLEASGGATARVGALFHCLAPRWDIDNLLPLVETRLTGDRGGAYAEKTWATIKTFLLDLDEGRFFEDDYLLGLEGASRRPEGDGTGDTATLVAEDAESHLDWVFLGLAVEGSQHALRRFRARLSTRAEELSPHHALALALAADDVVPSALSGQGETVVRLFSRIVARLRSLSEPERRACVQFARKHEKVVLHLVLSALLSERRITGRRFLVDVLSALSEETTVTMVAVAANAPWYFVRNVATVLGRRGERPSGPVLEALLEHPHEKVRREALKSLCKLGGAARATVEAFSQDPARRSEERQLAKQMLAR